MAKDDDLREKYHDLDKRQAVDEAIRARDWWWIKKLITMCLALWSAIAVIFNWLGDFLYKHYPIVQVGVDAMIAAFRSRNP